MEIEPIGRFRGNAEYKYTVPRQGVMNAGHPGVVELDSGRGFEQALRDLEGFDRVWLIFQFHGNEGWRPTVSPPILPPGMNRVGVFASRSPYRPNAIGLSCVRLLAVEPLRLVVDEADLLDGTPILDIKPYITKVDSFPEAKCGWVDRQIADVWTVVKSPRFHEQCEIIQAWQGPDLAAIAVVQLQENPFDSSRKRVFLEGSSGVFSIRMFRIRFACDATTKQITLDSIFSGYTSEDLADFSTDSYGDKALHRQFVSCKR